LVSEFRTAHLQLHGLTTHSLFDIHVQAGLQALKTPYCDSIEHYNPKCPVCCRRPPIAALAGACMLLAVFFIIMGCL
jgi:hypothetical protein